ncbi:hypothetical protein AAZX31_08G102800 [Glycine max]
MPQIQIVHCSLHFHSSSLLNTTTTFLSGFISIYMHVHIYHTGPCSLFQLILNLIVFIFLFSPLGCTIKCMKCKNGPTHVLLFFGGKIQRNVERVLVVGHAFICGMKLNSALHSVLFEIR